MPVADAIIEVYGDSFTPVGSLIEAQAVKTGTTDASGYFRMSSVGIGRYNVLALKGSSGAFEQDVEVSDAGDGTPEVATVVLQVASLGSVQGVARHDGGADHGGILVYAPGTSFVAVTSESGHFDLVGLPRGVYRIAASAATYSRAEVVGVTIRPGEQTLLTDDLVLFREVPVVDSLDRSFAGVGDVVSIAGRNFGSSRGTSVVSFGSVDAGSADYVVWSHDLISLRIPGGAQSGLVTVRTSLGEGSSTEQLQVLSVIDVHSGDGQIGKPSQSALEPLVVRVLDTSGEGVAGVTVTFVAQSGAVGPMEAVTDPNGRAETRFTFGSDFGEYVVRVSTPSLLAAELTLFAVWYDWVTQTAVGFDFSAAHLGEDGAVVVGSSGGDTTVLMLDSSGEIRWITSLGGSGQNYPGGVTVDDSGNVYVVGTIESGAFGGLPAVDPYAAFLAKLSPIGSVEWTQQFGTDHGASGAVVHVDEDGSVIVGGSTHGSFPGFTNEGWVDVFVARFTPVGDLDWVAQTGTNSVDQSTDLGVDGAGNVYLLGYTFGSVPDHSSAGGFDGLLVVLNSAGDISRVQQFGNENDNFPTTLLVQESGDLFIADPEARFSNDGSPRASITRFLADGTLAWRREFAEPGVYVYGAVLHNDDLYVVGSAVVALPGEEVVGSHDAYVARLGIEGNLLEARQYGTGSYDRALAILRSAGGGFVTLGITGGSFPGHAHTGGAEVYLLGFHELNAD